MPSKRLFSPGWLKDAIFYQIFPDRFYNGDRSNDPTVCEPWGNVPTPANFFGGDLAGIALKLDHLKKLKVNALYLTPIFKAETNHKYDTADYLTVDPAFGTNDEFKGLVDKLHDDQIKIILDGVFNHTGSGFSHFRDLVKNGEKSQYKDWYLVHDFPISINPTSYETCGGCTYLPKLNFDNPAVRSYILEVARYWIREFGIDGWRLDSAIKVPVHFWQEFNKTIKEVSPNAYLVGELWWEPTPWLNREIFDGGTNYLLRSLMMNFFAKHEMDAEDFRVEVDSLINRLGDAGYSMLNFLGSHDTPRSYTTFQGEVSKLCLAITFLFCMVGSPMISYGDEIGLSGNGDPDCRRCMVWDPDKWDMRIWDCYRQMTSLRSSYSVLRSGEYESLMAFDRLFAFRRFSENENILIILNAGNTVENIAVPTHSQHSEWMDHNSGEIQKSESQVIHISRMPAYSAKILIGRTSIEQ
jgi:glycosidase